MTQQNERVDQTKSIIFCENGHKIPIRRDVKENFAVPEKCPEKDCNASLLKFICPCCGKFHPSNTRGVCQTTRSDIEKELRKEKLLSKFNQDYCTPQSCLIGKFLSKVFFIGVVIAAAIEFSPSSETQSLKNWMFFSSSLLVPATGMVVFSLKAKKHKVMMLKSFLKREAPDLLQELKNLNLPTPI